MAALVLAEIPSHINTYERLATWAVQCLHNIGNGQEVNVAQGQQQQPIASCALVTTADGVPRFMLTAYLPCDLAAINDPAEKSWMAAGDIATAQPHTNYRSN